MVAAPAATNACHIHSDSLSKPQQWPAPRGRITQSRACAWRRPQRTMHAIACLSVRSMQLHAPACEACLCTHGGSRERNKGIAVSQKELKRGAIYATRINHSGLDLMHLIGRNTHYRCWPLRFARSALAASRFAMRSRNSRSVRCMAVSMSCRPAMESICP